MPMTDRPDPMKKSRPVNIDHGIYWVRLDDRDRPDPDYLDAATLAPVTEDDLIAWGWRGADRLYDRFHAILVNLGYDDADRERWNHLRWFVEYVYRHDLDWFVSGDEATQERVWLDWVAKAPEVDVNNDDQLMIPEAIDAAVRAAAGELSANAERLLGELLVEIDRGA